MNLSELLQHQELLSLGYDTLFLEKPMSHLVSLDYKQLLSPPPSNADQVVKKELQILHNATQQRSPKEIEFIHSVDQDLDAPFINLLDNFNLQYPKKIIKEYYDIVYPVLMNVKGFWNRPRPIQLAKFYNISINMIVTDTIHTPSYPSGHTVYSSLIAHIIKDSYPQLSYQSLTKIVENTAKARVMQGVHFPSDNAASLVFTKKIYEHLKSKMRSHI